MGAALVGCDVVINASNGPSPRKAPAVLVEGPHHLLDAGVRAGVGHHVCVSIVGIDAMPMAYYRVKLEQERVVESADVPWPIVRSTQSGRYVVEIPIPLPGKLGRALCEGGLTCVNPDVRGTETFAAGLKANAQ